MASILILKLAIGLNFDLNDAGTRRLMLRSTQRHLVEQANNVWN